MFLFCRAFVTRKWNIMEQHEAMFHLMEQRHKHLGKSLGEKGRTSTSRFDQIQQDTGNTVPPTLGICKWDDFYWERMIKSKAERGEPCRFQGLHPQPAVHLLQREALGSWWQVADCLHKNSKTSKTVTSVRIHIVLWRLPVAGRFLSVAGPAGTWRAAWTAMRVL